jgi:restriction system protein
LVDDVADIVVAASKRWPAVGITLGGLFCAVGAYLAWGNPKLMFGLAPIFGLLAGFAGLGCLAVGVVGLVKKRLAARDVIERFTGVWSLDAVRDMSWQEFERLIADLFRRLGYVVSERGRDAQTAGTGDGGVDLILTDPKAPGAEFLVQCKQYRAWDVGEPKVREFYGAMAAWRTRCEGIIVTCGRFSQPAQAFATGKPLRLIDGDGLLRMLNQYNAVAPVVQIATPVEVQAASLSAPQARTAPAATNVPACPKCKVVMVRRVAGKGPRKGLPFWGCPNYPACTVCINIAQ